MAFRTDCRIDAATVDPAEISRFRAIAAEWWDPEGKFAAAPPLNPVRLAWIRDRSPGISAAAADTLKPPRRPRAARHRLRRRDRRRADGAPRRAR
jgi:hypothetical protein